MDPATATSISLLASGLAVLIHKGAIHRNDDPENSSAKQESCGCVCYFEPKELMHCETWMATCILNSIAIFATSTMPTIQNESVKIACMIAAAFLMMMGIVMLLVLILTKGFCKKHLLNHETWIVCLWSSATSIALISLLLAQG